MANQVEEISSSSASPTGNQDEEDEEDEIIETENDAAATTTPNFHFLKTKPARPHCLVKTNAMDKWHAIINEGDSSGSTIKSQYWLPKLEKYAEQLVNLEVENHRSKKRFKKDHGADSEAAYLETVLRSGALGDKLSAHAVLLQVKRALST